MISGPHDVTTKTVTLRDVDISTARAMIKDLEHASDNGAHAITPLYGVWTLVRILKEITK